MPNYQTARADGAHPHARDHKPMVELYKNEGETPLECLERFRREEPAYADAVLSYVGRLDPMAEGVLLVVVDEENKKREHYLKLDKVYEVVLLLGIQTDTGDSLGISENVAENNPSKNMETKLSWVGKFFEGLFPAHIPEISKVLNGFVGNNTLPYPHYSSKTVNGKPLFQWAREDRLDEIEIPTRTSTIHSIELLNISEINTEELVTQALSRIAKVNGDFRQEEIKKSWNELFKKPSQQFPLISIRVSCSSGTYMRTLAEQIAEKLGTVGIAWKIKRTAIIKP